MKRLIPTLFTLLSFALYGQVGIGNTNPQAQLDISASNISSPSNQDGILIPRVTNLPVNASMSTNQDGMMVFYIGTGENGKGFYYWDETANDWIKIASGTISDDWTKSGNNINTSDFLGTTNNQPIKFRTNNLQRMILDQDGDLGINQTVTNATLDIGFSNGKNIIEATGNLTTIVPTTIVSNISGPALANNDEIDNGMTQSFITTYDGELDYIQFYARGSSTGNQDTRVIIRRNGAVIYNSVFSVYYTTSPTTRSINFPDGIPITTGFNYSVEIEDNQYSWPSSSIYGYYSTSNTYSNGNASGNAPSSGDLALRININRTVSSTGNVFVLNDDGQLSIGHSNPTTTLDILGDFKYRDGNQLSGNILVSDNGGNASWTDPATVFTDTDDQTLTLTGTTLMISGGNYVNLNSIDTDTDTDEQTIETFNFNSSTNILSLEIENDGIAAQTVDLSSLTNDLWAEVGQNIERRTGDVYIGDIPGTDNNLYISNNIIDWDDNSYFINPDDESFMNKIHFDAGSSAEPSVTFGPDTSTGFFRPSLNHVAFASNGSNLIQFTPRGQIEFNNTGGSIYLGLLSGESDDFSNNSNIGIGQGVLGANTTGDYNIGLGYVTLRDNISGTENVAIGHGSMLENETGGNNVALGSHTLNTNVDGNNNIGIGYFSLNDNVSGSNNIGIGLGALSNNTASDNIGIGANSGAYITTGTGNIGIGNSALGQNHEGNNNISIGTQSMLYTNHATNANGNIAMGNLAMATVTEGSNNIAIGNSALFGAYDIANNNTALGHQAGQGVIGNNNVYIGYQAGLNDGNSSNHLYIESSSADATAALIYGEFDNDILRFNGSVGIGRAPITNALEVEGQASKSTAGAFIANSDRRLKTNIKTIDSEYALNKLLALRGVTYQWNDDKTGINRPEELQYGFIAQELMEVFPEKVTKDNLGFYQTAYGDYDAVFVQAFKALNTKIETLEKENNMLREQLSKLEILEKRLLALESSKSSNLSKNDENNMAED